MSKEKKNGFLKLVILGVVLVGWLFKVDGEVWACSGEAECCNIVDQVWYCSGDHSELCSGSSDPYCANRGLGTCVRGPDSCFDSYTTGCILGWKNGVYGCNPQSCLPGQTHFSDTCSWGNVPDCNDSSAASCQGKDIGDACVNNGTCQDGNGDGACTCSGQDDPCTEGGWVDDACGWNNECETDQMRQTRSYTPAGCLPTEYQCIDDEVPACRPAVCVSSAIDTTVLVKDSSLVITVTGSPPESTINYFSLAFYNKDNLDGGNPKPIWFTGTTHYSRICYADGSSSGCTVSGNSATFTINYSELNYPDLNWGGGYPVNIQVNGYFGLADGGFSRADGNCVESFNMCAPTSPGVPVLTSPANGTETGLTVTLDWNGVGSWGEDCGAGVRNYLVYANQFIEATTRRTTTTATSFLFAPTDVGMWYWRVRAYNGAEYGNYSPSRSFCVEGGPYVVWGGWGACSALTHKQSKTGVCSEDCGTDDCVGVPIYEERDCVGTIMGYLFDASTYSTCPPSFSGVPMIANQSFTISGTWPLINLPVGTNASGYYTESVYSPGSYSFDFSALAGAGYVAIPKLSCQGSTADFVTNAETIGRDFGFWRDYGGWWQIIGGDVYGGGGIESIVPVSMPAGERYLIEEDANGNGGLAQYASGGIELGGGAGVYVSNKEWQAESGYGGQDINYEYYMAKMGIFDKTEWDGSGKPAYNPIDGDEIYTHTGDVTIDFSVDSGDKMVFMIDGNVLVDSDVTVALGSHLAVISSGIITFADNVGEVHGWWVGDRIVIESTGDEATDLQFRGEGSFVGWDAVEFNRDRGLTNNTAPAEEFIYRPDLMVNAPDSLKFSRYIWREMVP